jgi:protein TonB
MFSILMAALAQVAPLAGEPEASAPREIADPDWRRVKSPGSPLRYYPEKAQRAGVEGAATISCIVNASGLLHDCTVVEETPADYGFGEAAIKMSVLFRMRPLTKSGQKVDGGAVRLPIRFALPR